MQKRILIALVAILPLAINAMDQSKKRALPVSADSLDAQEFRRNVRRRVSQALFEVIELGDQELLDELFTKPLDQIKNDEGFTPLIVASQNGNSNVIKTLIKYGALVNTKDDTHKATPLHWAVYKKQLSATKELLATAAIDVNATNEHGATPLHIGIENNTLDIVKVLLEAKANVNALNINKQTPLHLAQSAEAVELLIKAGAQTEIFDKDKNAPLHNAAIYNKSIVIDALIKAGAKCNTCSGTNRENALHKAAFYGNNAAIESLLKSTITLGTQNQHNDTALHIALDRKKSEAVVTLLANNFPIIPNLWSSEQLNGIKLALYTEGYKNALTINIILDATHNVVALLSSKRLTAKDLNEKDPKGKTPLMWAIARQNDEVRNALLLYAKENNIILA